jgi:plasmid stabilization system protein ParE
MSLPVILRPEAERDLREIHEYLKPFGQSEPFAKRLQQVLLRIEDQPELYGFVWQDVRAVRVRRFLYVVYYIVLIDRVEVLAILHGSRHESAWQSRS